jgi:hypothetical protein
MSTPVTRFAVTMADGSVAILGFVTNGRSPTLPFGASWLPNGYWTRPAVAATVEAEVRKTFGTAAQSWRAIPLVDVPTDREFRDAWKDTGTAIDHDMTKARAIYTTRLRAERDKALASLDAQWMQATGKNDKQAADAAETKRQSWRDAPANPAIAAATNVEALKAISKPVV